MAELDASIYNKLQLPDPMASANNAVGLMKGITGANMLQQQLQGQQGAAQLYANAPRDTNGNIDPNYLTQNAGQAGLSAGDVVSQAQNLKNQQIEIQRHLVGLSQDQLALGKNTNETITASALPLIADIQNSMKDGTYDPDATRKALANGYANVISASTGADGKPTVSPQMAVNHIASLDFSNPAAVAQDLMNRASSAAAMTGHYDTALQLKAGTPGMQNLGMVQQPTVRNAYTGAVTPTGQGFQTGISPEAAASQVQTNVPEMGADGKPTGRYLPASTTLGQQLQKQGQGQLVNPTLPSAQQSQTGTTGQQAQAMNASSPAESQLPAGNIPAVLQSELQAELRGQGAKQALPTPPTPSQLPGQASAPEGSVVTGPSTGELHAQEAHAGVSGQKLADDQIASGNYTARAFPVQQALSAIEKLGPNALGPGSEARNYAASYVQSLFGNTVLSKVLPGVDPEKIAAFNEANKYMVQAASNNNLNTPKTNDGLAAMFSGNPTAHMDSLGAKQVLQSALALDRANTAVINSYQGDKSGYLDYKSKAGPNLDVRAFGVDMLTPDQAAKLKQSIGGKTLPNGDPNPAWTRFKNSYELAVQQGVLQHQPAPANTASQRVTGGANVGQ